MLSITYIYLLRYLVHYSMLEIIICDLVIQLLTFEFRVLLISKKGLNGNSQKIQYTLTMKWTDNLTQTLLIDGYH